MEAISSKISSQFQITIPGELRKKLGVKAGDTIVFMEEDNRIIVLNLKDLIHQVVESMKDLGETEKEFREGFRFTEE